MKKISDSKLGFEVGSGLKKSQSKYNYKGICKLYGGKEEKKSNWEEYLNSLEKELNQVRKLKSQWHPSTGVWKRLDRKVTDLINKIFDVKNKAKKGDIK